MIVTRPYQNCGRDLHQAASMQSRDAKNMAARQKILAADATGPVGDPRIAPRRRDHASELHRHARNPLRCIKVHDMGRDAGSISHKEAPLSK